jgi:hypothetical protein
MNVWRECMRPVADWMKVKAEYVTTGITMKELSLKYGLSFNTIRDHAKKEKWQKSKERTKDSIKKNTLTKIVKKNASTCANNLYKLGQSADIMTTVIEQILKDSTQFKKYIVTEGQGKGETTVTMKTFERYDTKALRDLCAAMKDVAIVTRNTYDLPTVQEAAAMHIAAERLKVEREKLDNASGGNLGEVEVSFEVEDMKELSE